MTVNKIKLFAVALFMLPLIALAAFAPRSEVSAYSNSSRDDAAATYKAKCAACHTAKADKFFDATKADDVLTEIILKGKKGEKPPYMPGFEAKGMTQEQAKALTEYMRTLKTPAN
jgi:mono/diheme cytochrome c family protein